MPTHYPPWTHPRTSAPLRLKFLFSFLLLLITLWVLIVPPYAHWVWPSTGAWTNHQQPCSGGGGRLMLLPQKQSTATGVCFETIWDNSCFYFDKISLIAQVDLEFTSPASVCSVTVVTDLHYKTVHLHHRTYQSVWKRNVLITKGH